MKARCGRYVASFNVYRSGPCQLDHAHEGACNQFYRPIRTVDDLPKEGEPLPDCVIIAGTEHEEDRR